MQTTPITISAIAWTAPWRKESGEKMRNAEADRFSSPKRMMRIPPISTRTDPTLARVFAS